jgi:hypothetical protein
MRRQTVYPGQIPLETDILSTNKNVMIAIGHLLQDMIGTSTLFSGLGCVPTSPAGMTVNVNPGRAYSYQATDTGAYSSLPADAHQIVKQGIQLDAVNFACPAPTTAGFSINYLIEGAFQEVDAGSVVLPYYNATNPAQAYSGPNGTGTSNTTYRDNTVQLQLKAGVAATSGSQVTPTPDAGFNGLWVISVPFGATSITSANISQYSGAPFLSNPLLTQLQAPIPGRLLRTTIFINVGSTTNIQASVDGGAFAAQSTWTALAAATRVEVQVQAAGGGGGGTPATGSGQAVASPGGGGGGYGFKTYVGASIPSGPISVTPGIGGLGGNGVTGFNGTASSFGALISTTGGAGGGAPAPLAGTQIQGGTVGGAAGTGGDINYAGQAALGSYSIAGARAVAGSGANSMFGVGGCGQQDNTSGSQATGFGSGGPGRAQGASAAALTGGAGTNGIVVVREFA